MTDTTLPLRDETREVPPPAPPPPVYDRASEPRRPWATVLAAALISALVSAGVTTALVRDQTDAEAGQDVAAADEPAPVLEQPAAPEGAGTGTDIAAVSAAVSPSVVHIGVAGMAGSGSGSGVVLREDGYILTNAHVVNGAEQVEVTLPDGSINPAEVVGADTASDLAVVQVSDGDDLPVPAFATTAPAVGDPAIAIGSPFGLEGSVTSGIVSALNRSLPGNSQTLVNMIQTDAAINPGNSGGALANGDGEVIGINTAILSPSGANDGIGFAIPITTALPIADQLIEQGFAEHAQLGIQGQDVDPQAAELYNLGVENGALVVLVAQDSAAEEAGLERGDIITAIDDEPVTSMADLAGQISAHAPGDDVTLTLVRAGEEQTVEVTLGSAPRE